ncbi:MAG: xanthine dehydrogenase family protein molybdopterin-binding subunit [Syntrophorhabdaceae bacterium]|nr:xanthine dehydrogenase family protein molybdopterin-binding subunit [Syntrophorhabdaceae bacterium]
MKERAGHFLDGPRLDAFSKVTGSVKYSVDEYPGEFLWAAAKRALVPHARLLAVHGSRAAALPGVVRVLTFRDVGGSNRLGIVRNHQPVLVDTVIRHAGDPVALVLARSTEALSEALELITFDYDPLPGIFDAEEALKEGTPRIHEDNDEGNLMRAIEVRRGDPAAAFRDCDVIAEGVFETSRQEHAYLETEAGWAYIDDGGVLVVTASTQTPYRDRQEMALALGLDADRVRVVAPYLGGAFGGKDGITVQCLLGLGALNSGGLPVKMWWDRRESFLAGVKRLPAKAYYRLGAKKDGTFQALSCRLYFDAGPYAGLTGEIMAMGVEHAGSAYRIPNVRIEGYCAYTNNALGGPFRGFGVPQSMAGMEQVVTMVAEKLSMDPIEVRRINALRTGDRNCVGVELRHSAGFPECIERLAEHPLWKDREAWKASAPRWKKRGCGIGCMAHAIGYPALVPDQANARVELKEDGTIRLYSGVTDMGQGNGGTYLRIAAEILNQDPVTMELIQPDTDHGLPSGSSSASRTTYTFGNAVIEAAGALRETILRVAAGSLGAEGIDAVELLPGMARVKGSAREIALRDVAALIDVGGRSCKGYFRAPYDESTLDIMYLGAHVLFSYGAHLARIEVDTLTGRIDVVDYVAVTDAGKVLNRSVYDQQVQGSIAQGIGWALTEDYIVKEGRHETGDLATYIVPTSVDVPDMVSIAVEPDETTGPFGMKGIGEVVISGCLPAIANAFHDACGVRIMTSPLTPERVLSALVEEGERG